MTKSKGFTLIEVILVVVILSISLTGVMSVYIQVSQYSANPVIEQQMVYIGESYLNEILSKDNIDPDGLSEGANRSLFDDVNDFNGLVDIGVKNEQNALVDGLDKYNIEVSVDSLIVSSVPLNRITVKVLRPGFKSVTLNAYK